MTPRAGATISECGVYRYRLWRKWGDGKSVCWIMLNPSTADGSKDDPTIRRCIGFAKDWGYAGIVVVNLFAFRATNPQELREVSDPVGPENDNTIIEVAKSSQLVVAAWGVWGDILGREKRVVEMLRNRGVRLMCLCETKGGHPRHPLYFPKAANPVAWCKGA